MSIEVAVTGNGRYAGSRSSVGDYTVLEESTAIEASDSSGGTGQITFSAVDDPSRSGSMLLLNDTVELTDGARGMTQGKINDIQGVNGAVAITADSRLGRLVIDTTSPGVNGTFGDAVFQYLALGGITDNIAIDSTLSTIPVVIPGWTGDLWRKINDLMVAYGAEIALVRAQVVVRKVRTRKALEINNISPTWRALNSEVAQNVEVAYYDTQYRANALVYPQGGWNDNVTVYTVEAGQTLTVNIPVNITLKSLIQPNVVDLVAQLYAGPSSMYSVIGSDGTAILATEWTAGGGSIAVAIGKDGKSIDATIQGAQGSISQYSPFRIAVNRGVNDYYSSLRISGTGIFYDRKTVIVPTGADANLTSREVGATVDNVHVQTEGQARSLALDVASRWASPRRTLGLKKVSVNKLRETEQNFDAATFQDFDTQYPTLLFSDFDTLFAGKTFAQFDQAYYDSVNTQFDFQVFGNANGSRFQWRRNMYRIRSARITAGEVDLDSEVDTTIGDFDALTPETPQYVWTERRRNYFNDPYGTSTDPAFWSRPDSVATSTVSDFPNATIKTAYRSRRLSAITTGVRAIVGTTLPRGVALRVRFKYRSTARLTATLRARPDVNSGSGETTTASFTIWPGEGEINMVVPALPVGAVLSATAGVGLIWTGGEIGDILDVTDFSVESNAIYQLDPDAKPFNPNTPNGPGYRTRWVGAPNASNSVYETSVQSGTAPMTFESFDEMYAGMTFDDFSLIPLPNVLPEYDRS